MGFLGLELWQGLGYEPSVPDERESYHLPCHLSRGIIGGRGFGGLFTFKGEVAICTGNTRGLALIGRPYGLPTSGFRFLSAIRGGVPLPPRAHLRQAVRPGRRGAIPSRESAHAAGTGVDGQLEGVRKSGEDFGRGSTE